MPTESPEGSPHVRKLLFVDDDRLLVQRLHGTWLIDMKGTVIAPFPGIGRLASSVHGERVCMPRWMGMEWAWFGDSDEDWKLRTRGTSAYVLDLATGAFPRRARHGRGDRHRGHRHPERVARFPAPS